MWNAIPSVTSGLALVAFLAAAGVEIMRRLLASRERQIGLAPDEDRLAMAQALSGSFLVLGRPIDADHLSDDQKFKIIMAQIQDRMRRFYVIAVSCAGVAICATTIFAFAAKVWAASRLTPGGPAERDRAVRLLQACYSRDYKAAFDSFSDQVKKQMTFGTVVTETDRMFAQFPKAPRYRSLERETEISGYWVVVFRADFDKASSFREVVSFVRTGSSWDPYHVDIMPATWEQTGTSRFLPASTAEVTKALRGLSGDNARTTVDKQFKGFYTPVPGWSLIAEHAGYRVAEQTCDVSSHDPLNGTPVMLKSVLGGCEVKGGERMAVFAKLSNATEHAIELESVRILK
jgi:hypothetical protein